MIVFIYLTDVHEGDGGLGKLHPLPIPNRRLPIPQRLTMRGAVVRSGAPWQPQK